MEPNFSAVVKDFLKNSVFPHEDRFCYYLRHTLFHLEAYTNCGLEGINNGIKNSSTPLVPSNRIDNSVKTIHMSLDVKARDNIIRLYDRATSHRLWSDSPTAPYVTDVCESMMCREWEKADEWRAVHIEAGVWYVDRKTEKMSEANQASTDTAYASDSFLSDDEDAPTPKEGGSYKVGPSGIPYGMLPKFWWVHAVRLGDDGDAVERSPRDRRRDGGSVSADVEAVHR